MDVSVDSPGPNHAAIPRSLADLHRVISAIGDIPPERVLLDPRPGTATEQDLLDADAHDNRICELIDGILVEKPVGMAESRLASDLVNRIETVLKSNDIGFTAGEAGFLKLAEGLVRIPDVSFVRWDRITDRSELEKQIPRLAPDLAVEILSPSNTRGEMARKRAEYFAAGTILVWEVDHRAGIVTVYSGVATSKQVDLTGALDGETVLPGFTLSVKEWFDWALRTGPR